MKILLVQTSFLGDVVLSTPVISGLKVIYPGCELWMMVHKAAVDLVVNDPLLSGVIVYDKHGSDRGFKGMLRVLDEIKRHNFTKVYSLHKSPRTSLLLRASGIRDRIGFKQAKLSFLYTRRVQRPAHLHDVERNLAILSGADEPASLRNDLRLFAPRLDSVFEKFGLLGLAAERYVVLVPGSAWKTKMWNWQGYRAAAERFRSLGFTIVLLGAPDERNVADLVGEGLDVVNLVGQTSIAEMLALVSKASLQICNDSLSLHVASAFKIPCVAIFCSTSPSFGFGPWKNRNTVLEVEGLPCKPCGRHGWQSCPTGTEACMRELPADRVISAGMEMLRQ